MNYEITAIKNKIIILSDMITLCYRKIKEKLRN